MVNAAAALVKIGWTGFSLGVETWAVIMLAVAAALVVLVMLKLRNAAFPLPVAWAYFGIHQNLKPKTASRASMARRRPPP